MKHATRTTDTIPPLPSEHAPKLMRLENPLTVMTGLLATAANAGYTVTQTIGGVQIAFAVLATTMPFLVLLALVRAGSQSRMAGASKPTRKKSSPPAR